MDDSGDQWDRVFELASELVGLPADDVEARLQELRADGESEQVLRRVRIYLRIPSEPSPSPQLAIDSIVAGEYRIVGHLGSGGMGIVYEAVLEKTGKTVALKMMHPNLVVEDSRERFFFEMKALGRLEHRGIVSILHAGSHTDQGGEVSEFFTMDRIVGVTLREYLKTDEATTSERLRIVRDVAIAVEYAHDREVIHRDLKPANMMVQADGQVKIFDFGLAAAVFLNEDGRGPSVVGGTPPYMAPEQALAETTSPTADVYSLGAILYEILFGQPIYQIDQSASYASKLQMMRNPPPPPFPYGEAPEGSGEILEMALAPAPENRHQSAAEFARALNRLLPAHLVHDPPHQWHPAAGLVVPATDWVLEERLGDGAHGQVWLARNRPVVTSDDPLIPSPRVYKFCDSEKAARALRREVRVFHGLRSAAGGKLSLRGIVPIESWSLDRPPYYIAMRHMPGAVDLGEWAVTAKVSEEAALAIICDVAKALEFSHGIGVLHRDVKPGNILVREDPGAPGGVRAWLVDFGLASFDEELWKSVIAKSISTREDYEKFVGTPEYIAPEIRISGYTTRSDIYSLGVVAYRLLQGNLAATLNDWKERVADPVLRDDLEKCLSDDPEERFDSAGALATRLGEIPRRREETEIAKQHEIEAKATREAELERAAKSAYRLGILRTTIMAATVALLLAWLWFTHLKKQEAWHNESRLRLAEIQAVRLSSRPGNYREILDRIEEAGGKHPQSDRQALRNQALSVLSLPPPYGELEKIVTQLPQGSPVGISGNWLVWHDGKFLKSAQISAQGLIDRLEVPLPGEIEQVATSSEGGLISSVSKEGELSITEKGKGVSHLDLICETQGLAIHESGYVAVSGKAEQLLIFVKAGSGWELAHTIGRKVPDPAAEPTGEVGEGEFIGSVELLEFSPDARYLAFGGGASLFVRIFDLVEKRVITRCRHEHYPTALAWDKAIAGRLWTTSADGAIFSWEKFDRVSPGQDPDPIVTHGANSNHMPFVDIDTSPDGAYLVGTNGDGGRSFFWKDGLELKEFKQSGQHLLCGYLQTGEMWTITRDSQLRLRIADTTMSSLWAGGEGAFLRIARGGDGRLLAGVSGSEVIVSDASGIDLPARLRARGQGIGVTFFQNEPKLFSTDVVGINTWEWEITKQSAHFDGPAPENPEFGKGEAVSMVVDQRDWLILSTGAELMAFSPKPKPSHVWMISEAAGLSNPVTGLAAPRVGSWFAVSRGNGVPTVICTPAGKSQRPLSPLPGTVLGITCSVDGAVLVERTEERVVVRDSATGDITAEYLLELPLLDPRTYPVHSAPVAVTDDGSLLAASAVRSRIVLFQAGLDEPIAELQLPDQSAPTALLFTGADDLVIGTANGQWWTLRIPAIRAELGELGLDWEPSARASRKPDPLTPVYSGS